MTTTNLFIVLPAYNEQGNLPSLIVNLETALGRLLPERLYMSDTCVGRKHL